jgi:hypothetical protein
MPIKPLIASEMDLVRAWQIVRALAPLKRLKHEDAEIVARTIAQIRAEGRKQGLDIATEHLNACREERLEA